MPFKVKILGEEKVFQKPVKVLDVVGNNKDYVCARIDNRVRELTYVLENDCHLEPLTCKDSDSIKIYEASLRFLVAMAMHNIAPHTQFRFSYNVSRSVFMQILNGSKTASTRLTLELEKEMNRLIALDIPMVRTKISTSEAMKIYEEEGFNDKLHLMKYRPEKDAHLYTCDNYKNYMYERMVPSTGYIKKFNQCVKGYYSCEEGYTLNEDKCEKVTETIDATPKLTCEDGYELKDQLCVKNETKDAKNGYYCATGYTLNGNMCQVQDIKAPVVNANCPNGYTLYDNK